MDKFKIGDRVILKNNDVQYMYTEIGMKGTVMPLVSSDIWLKVRWDKLCSDQIVQTEDCKKLVKKKKQSKYCT
jgi:hypothetical protein